MRLHPLLFSLLLVSPALSQLKPGTHLVCAAGSYSAAANNRGIFVMDRHANTQARMPISGIPWSYTAPVRTFVESPVNFLLGVRQGTGQVYRVTWNRTWTAKRLTTSAVGVAGDVLWDITRIGKWIYVTTSKGGATAINGKVWRVAASGGTPVLYMNIGARYQGMPTAMTAVGPILHVFLWDSSRTTGARHLSINTAAKTPKMTALGNWPIGKARTCVTLSVLPTQASYDSATKLLVIGGRLGNLLWRTTSGVTVRQVTVVKMGCNPPRTTWGLSMGFNSDTGAILYGTQWRNMDEQRCRGGTWKRNVTPIGVSSGTAINGIEYVRSGSLYREGASGCKQGNGQILCHYPMHLPIPGNKKFGIGVESTSKLGLLMFGVKTTALSLGNFGAPGCTLGVLPVLFVPAKITTSGLELPIPLPMSLQKGAPIYTQWLIVSKVNKLGLIVSGVRRMVP